MNTSFFGELLQTISERGRALLDRARERRSAAATASRSENLIELCEALLSGRGEASGVALAREILGIYDELDEQARVTFFEALARNFGADVERLKAAIDAWRGAPNDENAAELHAASEPRRQELFRRLNLAPGGTRLLVNMRENLMDLLGGHPDLRAVDEDFVHLFSSWFNRGFLVIRRIDWSTPASVLERLIQYEAVHKIRGWDDLRRRTEPADRRCYAFFHPALVDDPLIFVEVALMREIPAAIAPILSVTRETVAPGKATTAVFYSISNCQRGLAGVSFGHFLIKQVVEEVCREQPKLSIFVTLSPAPNFADWLAKERANENSTVLSPEARTALANLDIAGWWQKDETREPVREPLLRAAAHYFLNARNSRGAPVDSVARFHLGNGARLEQIDWLADGSEKAMSQSHGLMVNYLYDLDDIEKNHEAYAEGRTVVASNAVQRLLRPPLELVPIAG